MALVAGLILNGAFVWSFGAFLDRGMVLVSGGSSWRSVDALRVFVWE